MKKDTKVRKTAKLKIIEEDTFFDYLKQFLAGALPAFCVYLFVFIASYFYPAISRILPLWWIIFVFGAVNIAQLKFLEKKWYIIEDWNLRTHLIGAFLGLATALFLIFRFKFFTLSDILIRILVFPILGALIWRYAVHYLNVKFEQI